MSTQPMFSEPEKGKARLSDHYSRIPEHRVGAGEKARYQVRRVKKFLPCNECAWLQHETQGEYFPVRAVRRKRISPQLAVLELCAEHAGLWQEQDKADGGE